MGGAPEVPVPRGIPGRGRPRPVPRRRPGPRQAPRRLGDLRLRTSAGHRPAGTGRERAARRAARRQRPRLGLRTAHAQQRLRRLQPVRPPHRLGLPHDTATAVHGLVRAGFPEPAAALATGLLHASRDFGARLPELFAGYGTDSGSRPAPYPAACRPQAWAAASAVLVLQSLLGLTPDAPHATLTISPQVPRALLPLRATGLELAGAPLEIALSADGTPTIQTPPGITVQTAG